MPAKTLRAFKISTGSVTEDRLETDRLAHLAAIVESSQDAIISLSLQGVVRSWNSAAERIFGYSAAEAVGQSIALIVPKDRWSEEADILRRIRRGRPIDHYETVRIRKSGNLIDISLTVSPIRSSTGKIIGVSKIARDITLARKAQEELRASKLCLEERDIGLRISEERYARATRAGGVGVWEINLLSDELYLAPNLKELLGYTDDELPSTLAAWNTLVHPEDRAAAEAAANGHLAGRTPTYQVELRRRHKNGTYRWFFAQGTVVRSSDGTAERFIGSDTDVDQRKRMEDALRESEERLRLGLEAGNTGTWDWDILHDSVRWSERLYELHGLDAGAFGGRVADFARLVHPDDAERVSRAIEDAIRTGTPYELQFRIVRPNSGEVRWMSTRGQVYYDKDGMPLRMLGATSDVTEWRRAEERYRTLFERMTEGFAVAEIVCDTEDRPVDFRFLEINPAFERLTGLARGDVVGKLVSEALPGIEPVWIDRCGYAALTGEPVHFDHYAAALNRHFEVFAYRTQPRQFAVLFVDVTERQNAEAVVRERELWFRELADTMPQIVFAARPDGYVDYFNRQWYEYTGLPEADPGTENWWQVHTEEGLKEVQKVWPHAVAHGTPYEIEYRLRRADGTYRWHLGRARPVRNEKGEIVRWFGTNTDIHDYKQLQERYEQLLASERWARAEAERASQLKDDFLATVSHELRTPLNAILGYAQLLRRARGGPDDGLAVIERNARVQKQIIEDILDMSRIVSGKLGLNVGEIDLDQLTRAAIDTVLPLAAGKGVELSREIEAGDVTVRGDAARLQQVVWNLLTNAVKFTPAGGKVSLSVRCSGTHVEIVVADTGQGISSEFLPFVFDKFRQADASTTRRHGGLGLGLSIVKSLVELHGGTVRVHSQGTGRGTTFTVAIPAARSAESAAANGSGSFVSDVWTKRPSLSGVSVLAVDDEHDGRELVRRLLEECGAQVLTASSAKEALALFDRYRIDVLVSDIGMPDIDGYELLRQVRARGASNSGDVAAAALTAFARAEDRTHALRAGFQTHITKPVEPLELLTAVADLAGRREGFS